MLSFKNFSENKKIHLEQRLDEYIQGLFIGGWEGDKGCPEYYGSLEEAATPQMSPAEVEAKRREVVAPKMQKMVEVYGPAASEAPRRSEIKADIEHHFDRLSAMTPAQRKSEYSAANKRAKTIGLGGPTGGNQKTDTAADIPASIGPNPNGGPHREAVDAPNGHIPIAIAMPPDERRHYTSPDASTYHTSNVCGGSTEGCRLACLAKHGNYTFATNQGHRDVLAQSLTHNSDARRDYATRLYQQLESTAQKAKEEGKHVLMRPSTTDEETSDTHGDAIAKHFGLERVQSDPEHAAKHAPVILMRYTKQLSDHNPERGIHSIYSDSGPMVTYKRPLGKDGKVSKRDAETPNSSITPVMNRENIGRRALLRKAVVDRGMNSYMVFDRKRPGASDGPDSPATKQYESILNKLKTVRRYEPLPSEPKAGEETEYHDPRGFGRIVHGGKSFRYQDHPVADKIKSVSGEDLFPADHDARNADYSSRTFYSPEGKKVGHVVAALATASTSNTDLHNSGFFHHTENIDENGIYHDGHPAELENAGFDSSAFKGKVATAPKIVTPNLAKTK